MFNHLISLLLEASLMPQIVEKISEDSEVDVEVCLELVSHLN